MNSESISIENLLNNLNKKKKLGIAAFLIIALIIVAMILGFINSLHNNPSSNKEEVVKNSTLTESGVEWDDISNGNQEEAKTIDVPVSTEYNDEHKYTLIEHLPFARFAYKDYGQDQHGVRGYWIITENTAVEKGIIISVDDCDEEGNTAAANEYLSSLPVDLSGYIVVYQTHVGDVPCNIP